MGKFPLHYTRRRSQINQKKMTRTYLLDDFLHHLLLAARENTHLVDHIKGHQRARVLLLMARLARLLEHGLELIHSATTTVVVCVPPNLVNSAREKSDKKSCIARMHTYICKAARRLIAVVYPYVYAVIGPCWVDVYPRQQVL
jgi:hypothetical protein